MTTILDKIDVQSLPVNPDLAKDRETGTFSVQELTHILDGGKQKTLKRKELEKIVYSDPIFHNKDRAFLSKSEAYERALQKSVRMFEWRRQYNWTDEDLKVAAKRINGFDEAFNLHHDMFIPALERLANAEQRAKWIPLALNYQVLGTYAQTELGHGTNLSKLETTATFDPRTDEFVMNSPRVSSIKWWPGALAKTTNHAIVLAQLVIGGKNYGLQPFLVQIRSIEDHTPLPGVKLGDIGPKMIIQQIDNGFLMLNNVRIPRTNMLMANAEVSRDGKFRSIKSDKSNYSTLMYVRVEITKWAYDILSRAVTTGIRYSSVRRQSSLKPGEKEVQIIEYQSQQYKNFPALATAYALFFVSSNLTDEYNKTFQQLMKGDKALMAEMHSQTSVMKAMCSDLAAMHCEIVRRSLGGHGHMLLSGVALNAVGVLGLITVEGENTVLYQQSARYLIKQVAIALSGGQTSPSCNYLKENSKYDVIISSITDCRDLNLLLEIYRKMAQRNIIKAAQSLQADMEKGMAQHEAWNKNMVALVKAAQMHGIQFMVAANVDGINQLGGSTSTPVIRILRRLACLFALYHIDHNAGSFLETDAVNTSQLEIVRAAELQLMTEIRPEAVSLVDAFDIHDYSLQSVLGCYDGNVYEKMYQHAQMEPMNKTEVHPAYYKYLRGLIKGSSKL